jgi:hypothetical protein
MLNPEEPYLRANTSAIVASSNRSVELFDHTGLLKHYERKAA